MNRCPVGHARELGTRPDPPRRVPRCCPRSPRLSLSLLLFRLLSLR
ncbi:hypothetical protein STXM2123_3551 [Streptomyces sp. F-3]|nr:hypothetical protein STXM2123_3551 [Streptomyces sp. F-3]